MARPTGTLWLRRSRVECRNQIPLGLFRAYRSTHSVIGSTNPAPGLARHRSRDSSRDSNERDQQGVQFRSQKPIPPNRKIVAVASEYAIRAIRVLVPWLMENEGTTARGADTWANL